ncbi:hypothetical protein MCC93_18740 [Morococcus cerebrosus]|uniref:Uncharacterized protein n=1 Tax=Morococcus cerebrosus TaxID=1056807 RepID=A0A0C1GY63_9NEIS|nr:hypothetical protein MCC93_18740 [Morococcus cerebrosus]
MGIKSDTRSSEKGFQPQNADDWRFSIRYSLFLTYFGMKYPKCLLDNLLIYVKIRLFL